MFMMDRVLITVVSVLVDPHSCRTLALLERLSWSGVSCLCGFWSRVSLGISWNLSIAKYCDK